MTKVSVQFQCIDDLIIHGKHRSPRADDWPTTSFKNASIDYVRAHSTDYVRGVLDKMPFSGARKRVLVDVKVHDLETGWFPAIPGWHIDGVQNIAHAPSENGNVYFLFISGDCSLTQFLSERVCADVVREERLDYDAIFARSSGVSIQPNVIYQYTLAPHRASRAAKSGRRLLIRAVETNCLRPRNTSFNVHYQQ